mmetsp:Transcript_45406/g.129575  ORF Transcript_45406/g.129575 Transcript_45406/m.129575 type:complete len:203 (-) Transcript_45406:324-932(-)
MPAEIASTRPHIRPAPLRPIMTLCATVLPACTTPPRACGATRETQSILGAFTFRIALATLKIVLAFIPTSRTRANSFTAFGPFETFSAASSVACKRMSHVAIRSESCSILCLTNRASTMSMPREAKAFTRLTVPPMAPVSSPAQITPATVGKAKPPVAATTMPLTATVPAAPALVRLASVLMDPWPKRERFRHQAAILWIYS